MSRFIAALVLAATFAGAANAEPGNAVKQTAQMGQITQHGVWDAR